MCDNLPSPYYLGVMLFLSITVMLFLLYLILTQFVVLLPKLRRKKNLSVVFGTLRPGEAHRCASCRCGRAQP